MREDYLRTASDLVELAVRVAVLWFGSLLGCDILTVLGSIGSGEELSLVAVTRILRR